MPKVDPNTPVTWEVEDESEGNELPWAAERDALQGIFRLLQEHQGVDFSRYRQTTVSRRVSRRMSLAKQPNLAAYIELLRSSPVELELLHGDLLLSITQFFRDPDTFAMLKRSVFPTLVERRSHKLPIRVWVPGCATGEEVYSLAICFHEFMDEHQVKVPIQFFGTDISEKNIAAARTGHYPFKIEGQLTAERLERHFDKSHDGYRVNKAIRERCVFAVQDLGRDPPFANVDLVSCRNVLIYFEEELQELATSLFHFALNVAGYLLLGVSENLQTFGDLFAPVEGVPNLLRKRVPSMRRNQSYLWGSRSRSPAQVPRIRSAIEPRKADDQGPEQLADRAILAEYGPPGVLIDSQLQIRQFRGRVAVYLEPASGSASLKVSKMVRADLMPDLFVALEEVKKTRAIAKRTNVAFAVTPEIRSVVDIVVLPLRSESDDGYYLVLFERGRSELTASVDDVEMPSADTDAHNELFLLRRELKTVKHQLKGIIEEKEVANQELWTANEEIQSANEELQSVNEEMEAAKEELESANEELVTLNEELHRKNLALSESEGRFRGLVESSADWIWETDERGVITYSSPRIQALLGFEPSEVVGQSLLQLLPDVWSRVYQAGAVTPEGTTNLFSSAQHKSGSAVVFDTSCVLREGGRQSLRGVSRDISERVTASERLRRSEESLALAQEIANLGHWEFDLRGSDHLWSNQMYRMLGVPDGRVPSLDEFLLLVHPDDRPSVLSHIERVTKSGVASHNEWRTNPEHGPSRVFDARAMPIRGADGTVYKLIGTLLDVTDKRHAELAQREIESRFKVYVDAAPDAIFVVDEDGAIQEANEAAAVLFGCPRLSLVGRPSLEFIAADDLPRYLAEMAGLRAAGRASGEFWVRRLDGAARRAHVEGVRLSPARTLIFAKDVTDHKAAQDALRQAQENLHHAEKMQAIGQLAGGVAHDFNNQLTTVLAFTELLRREVTSNDELTSYCDQIMGGIKRASDLTAQLLAYSRKGKYQSIQVDLNELVVEVSTLLSRTIDKKVDVQLELPAAPCATLGDPTQLQNVLLNLALNARDAMVEGGKLTMATRVVGSTDVPRSGVLGVLNGGRYVELRVADTGIGMTPEVLGRIFEPFYSTKAPGKGLGMGLPSVYGAVIAHHGAIRVQSEVGRGSTFFVYLPAVDVQTTAEASALPPEPAPKRSARIMVVEDEPTLRGAVCTVLTHLGHTVKGCANGREAVEHYRDHWGELDLVILDMIMPVMNGRETFLALKAINPDVVALLASGYSLEGEAEEVLRSGVKGFLQKPFKMEDLARGVTEVLAGQFRPSRSPARK